MSTVTSFFNETRAQLGRLGLPTGTGSPSRTPS